MSTSISPATSSAKHGALWFLLFSCYKQLNKIQSTLLWLFCQEVTFLGYQLNISDSVYKLCK